MNQFLPDNYERPTSSGNYMKFTDGANKLRILSTPIIGHEYWTKDKKPVRSREPFQGVPEDAKLDEGKFKPKFFWAMAVWNYAAKAVQVLEITQASIIGPIEELLVNSDWGDPREYDLTINKKGEGLETEYSAQPSPEKPVPEEALTLLKATQIDLEALYRSEDPFKGPATVAVADEDQIASSKPNDFKDFGEE